MYGQKGEDHVKIPKARGDSFVEDSVKPLDFETKERDRSRWLEEGHPGKIPEKAVVPQRERM